MKRAFFMALAVSACAAGLCAQPSLADFYDTADSVTAHPPFQNELMTLCQVPLQARSAQNGSTQVRWVSFVGFKSTKTVLYVAITLDSLADPVADVSPIVGYEKARPVLGKVPNWGYPFDRNRDGKVDYLALVGGAGPYMDGEFPADYPAQSAPMMMSQVEFYLEKCRIIFNHWADDNYDGQLDATVQADMDARRSWVYRQIAAQQTKFDGTFDKVTTFRNDGSAFSDTLTREPGRFGYRSVAGTWGWFGAKELAEKTAVMALINKAIAASPKDSFRLPDGRPVE